MKKSLFLVLIMILSLSAQWSSDKFGYVRWPQPVQVTGAGLGQTANRIIKTSDNAAVIAFGDQYVGETFDVPPWVIYKTYITLNKIDTTGALLWGENGVRATVDTAQQQDLVIIPDETGGAYLTWNDRYPVGGDPDSMIIRLQRISYEGQRMWGDSGRYVYKAPQYQYPKPFVNNRLPDGIFFVHGEKSGVTMESIEPDGLINWSRVNNWYGRPIPVNDGGAAWAFKHRISHTGEYLILANRMDSEGNLMWSDSGLVIENNVAVQSGVKSNVLSDNTLIVYYPKDPTLPNYKTFIQIINDDGSLQFPDSSISISNSTANVAGIEIIPGNSTNFILTWIDYNDDHFEWYCQKFNKKMERLWGERDVLYSRKNHENAATIRDDAHGFIEVWDRYSSPVGVFAQQVSKDGKLGEVVTGIENIPEKRPDRFKLFQNYPNPFNSITMISFILPAKSHVKIIVYNAIGQKVKELFNGDKQSGYHRVIWNGADQNNRPVSSGVYYIKLESEKISRHIKALLLK